VCFFNIIFSEKRREKVINMTSITLLFSIILIFTSTYGRCAEDKTTLSPQQQQQQEVKENFIYVTEISTDTVNNEKTIRIVLNNAIEVNDIKIKKYGSSNIIAYPSYISETTGKEFKQVRVISTQAKKAIEDAIFNNRIAHNFNPTQMNFSITKLTPYKKDGSPVKAFVTVTFNDAIEVDARVMSGKYGLWVAYPTKNITNRKGQKLLSYMKQFNIIDKDLKKKVDTAILNKYREVISEEPEN